MPKSNDRAARQRRAAQTRKQERDSGSVAATAKASHNETPRHPNKHIRKAVEQAIAEGWRLKKSEKGHAWGRLYCPHASREGCTQTVLSTPMHPQDHAKDIVRSLRSCPHPEAALC